MFARARLWILFCVPVCSVLCVLYLVCSLCSMFVLSDMRGRRVEVCTCQAVDFVLCAPVCSVLCVLYLVCSMCSMFVLSDVRGRGVEVCTCQAVDLVH